MKQRIGTCSLCGGDVTGWFGVWGAVVPPPPPSCEWCGAVPKGSTDVIEMEPARRFQKRAWRSDWSID